MSEPICSTERFDIFEVFCERNQQLGFGRSVYLAFHRSEDIPRPLCVVTLGGNYVEWVEVDPGWRRRGVASEVMRGLEKLYGLLVMDAATEEGEGFVASYNKDDEVEVD